MKRFLRLLQLKYASKASFLCIPFELLSIRNKYFHFRFLAVSLVGRGGLNEGNRLVLCVAHYCRLWRRLKCRAQLQSRDQEPRIEDRELGEVGW